MLLYLLNIIITYKVISHNNSQIDTLIHKSIINHLYNLLIINTFLNK